MTAEKRPNRAVEAVLPEDLELTPQPQPVEAPPPEVMRGDLAEDRSALAFLKVFKHRNYRLFFAGHDRLAQVDAACAAGRDDIRGGRAGVLLLRVRRRDL